MSSELESVPWRHRMHEVIFEADTPSGKAFDVALLLAIVLSVVAVLLESVAGIRARVNAVDGTLTVTSPPGGPTTLTAEIPRQ